MISHQLTGKVTIQFIILILLFSPLIFSQSASDIDELDTIFSSWDSATTPGCAVGVSEKGVPLVFRSWGMADLENPVRNTPSTIFEAGSVSKQFVSGSLILLALEGELSLDDDVRQYIPELPDYDHSITLRHLLNHTSGLRDWGSVASISGWGRGQRSHNHDHVLDILSRQSELNFPPGERYSYSNSGYNLLAIVIERVAGIPFAEYSSKNIFEPLGMTSTQWRDDYTRIVPGRSTAYSGSEGDHMFTINRPIEYVHGNGGLLTTVGDLLTWSHAVSSGFFGDGFYDELTTRGVLSSGRTIEYASGVQISTDHGQPQIVHTGATSGYRAYLSTFPEQNLSVALLCNVTGANPGVLGSEISKLFLGDDATIADQELPEGISTEAAQLESKTGIWADPRNHRHTEIVLENDTLSIKDGDPLISLSENEFNVGSSDVTYRFIKSEEYDRPLISVAREGYTEETLIPVDPSNEQANPEVLLGTYDSHDAETAIRIVAEDDKLIAKRRPADSFELEPVFNDTFLAPGFGLIRFHRNESGDVIRFSYSSGRVYDMNFTRTDE